MTLWVTAIAGVVACILAVHLARWRRQSRADWNEWDAEHGAPTSTRASQRARREMRKH